MPLAGWIHFYCVLLYRGSARLRPVASEPHTEMDGKTEGSGGWVAARADCDNFHGVVLRSDGVGRVGLWEFWQKSWRSWHGLARESVEQVLDSRLQAANGRRKGLKRRLPNIAF